jgi:hypothetical protein
MNQIPHVRVSLPFVQCIRAAAEGAATSVKAWRMRSSGDGCCCLPISTYGEMLAAVTGLFYFKQVPLPSL